MLHVAHGMWSVMPGCRWALSKLVYAPWQYKSTCMLPYNLLCLGDGKHSNSTFMHMEHLNEPASFKSQSTEASG